MMEETEEFSEEQALKLRKSSEQNKKPPNSHTTCGGSFFFLIAKNSRIEKRLKAKTQKGLLIAFFSNFSSNALHSTRK